MRMKRTEDKILTMTYNSLYSVTFIIKENDYTLIKYISNTDRQTKCRLIHIHNYNRPTIHGLYTQDK